MIGYQIIPVKSSTPGPWYFKWQLYHDIRRRSVQSNEHVRMAHVIGTKLALN